MAIIKCPECGHQISDKAPVCPSCGVEIAGKLTRCTQCGEIFFKDQDMCPNCHHANPSAHNSAHAAAAIPTPPRQEPHQTREQPQKTQQPTPEKKPKKHNYSALIVSLILALIVCGVCFYYYSKAKNTKEAEAYEYAMSSDEPQVLQSYLDTYKDASETHRDAILNRLTLIRQTDKEWTDAVVSNSKTAFLAYLKKYPDSQHKAEAKNKIDSLDWNTAKESNTEASYQAYLDEHPNGKFFDEAGAELKKIKLKNVQPEEKNMIASVFRGFFQGINSKNSDGVTAAVNDVMTNFLGHEDAGKSDAISFMNKNWKEDVTNVNWHILNDYRIEKKEVGTDEYEYSVGFTATRKTERTDKAKNSEEKFRIKARVNPNHKISEFNMAKILE